MTERFAVAVVSDTFAVSKKIVTCLQCIDIIMAVPITILSLIAKHTGRVNVANSREIDMKPGRPRLQKNAAISYFIAIEASILCHRRRAICLTFHCSLVPVIRLKSSFHHQATRRRPTRTIDHTGVACRAMHHSSHRVVYSLSYEEIASRRGCQIGPRVGLLPIHAGVISSQRSRVNRNNASTSPLGIQTACWDWIFA